MITTALASVAAAMTLPLACSALPASMLNEREVELSKTIPISVQDYESAMGLHRRDSEQFSDLNFQTQSQFIYGSPGCKFSID